MKKTLLALLLLLTPFVGGAQNLNHFTQELTGVIDNDVFLVTDFYYTAGHQLTYRKVVQRKTFLRTRDSAKLLVHVRYGNKVFTPRVLRAQDSRNMDRPYAGWSAWSTGFSRYKRKTVDAFELEVGLIGPISGMGNLQVWWHNKFGLPRPRGWALQIADEVVMNVNYNLIKQFKLDSGIDLVTQSGVFAGTGNNRLSQQFVFRAGDLNPIHQSVFYNGRLGSSTVRHKQEFFVFIGFEIDYVFSNIFIEGSLFDGNASPVTKNAMPLVTRNSYGLMHATERSSFGFAFNFLSREIEGTKKHGYTTILYSYRF